ncbi:MAG: hypothetical protein ACHQM6_09095 [Candidatus Kapaibacterium sp.]
MPDYYFNDEMIYLHSDYYLLKGFTSDEYDKVVKQFEENTVGLYCSTGVRFPEGYWMIGNSKTNKIIKVGFRNYQAVVSSSGNHILFYQWSFQDNAFDMKVVSVKVLTEGMQK